MWTRMIHIHCMCSHYTCSLACQLTVSMQSPLVMKVRSRSGSIVSGASTPGGETFPSLSEGDLRKADAALSRVNGEKGINGVEDAR
jgi:hypothetical protein